MSVRRTARPCEATPAVRAGKPRGRRRGLRRALAPVATVALVLAGSVAGTVALAAPASAGTTLCGDTDHTAAGAQYVVQNNQWNSAGVDQCIDAGSDGFQVTSGDQNVSTSGAPAGYPSIFAGCHYTVCSSTSSGLPLQISSFGDPHTTVTYHTASGQWDAAYDIWTDPTPNPSGQNHGSEIMIWGNHQGQPQPAGSNIGTASIDGATWDVWSGQLCGDGCWTVNSYVRQSPTDSLDVHIKDFTDDSISRGITQSSWYLTSVQFGFEPWQGGPGLGVDSFSYSS